MSYKLCMILLIVLTSSTCIYAETEQNSDLPIAKYGTNVFFDKQFINASNNIEKTSVLINWVLETSMASEINNHGITVSDEEQTNELKRIYRDDENVINNLNTTIKNLPIALKEALASPENEKVIYEKYLSPSMSYSLWKGHLKQYNSKEKIEQLEHMSPVNKKDLYQPIPSLKTILLKRKLKNVITDNITVSETSVYEAYTHQYPEKNIPYDDVHDEIKDSLLKVRKHEAWESWKVETLKQANVEIIDQSLAAVYQRTLSNLVSENE